MRIEFTNGATVHSFWKDLPDGQLVAAFQYDRDARDFAEVAARRIPEGSYLMVVDHGVGATWRYNRPPGPNKLEP